MFYDQTESSEKDLSFKVLERYFKEKKGISAINIDLLKTLGLIQNNQYVMAAELFSDTNKSLGIDIVRFGNSISEFKDRIDSGKKSILLQYEESLHMFEKHYPKIDIIAGLSRESHEQVPTEAFREALANAIVHRDYTKISPIKLTKTKRFTLNM